LIFFIKYIIKMEDFDIDDILRTVDTANDIKNNNILNDLQLRTPSIIKQPTVTPPQPTVTPPQPTVTPPQPVVIPRQPVVIPQQQQPVVIPRQQQPVVIPRQQQPVVIPRQQQPVVIPRQQPKSNTICMPHDPVESVPSIETSASVPTLPNSIETNKNIVRVTNICGYTIPTSTLYLILILLVIGGFFYFYTRKVEKKQKKKEKDNEE
jgi:hypothetical protein